MSDFKKTALKRSVRISTSVPLVLGYTRTGKPVLRPNVHDDDGAFGDWTRGDHTDAGHILKEHCDRESNRRMAACCKQWARTHKALGGR